MNNTLKQTALSKELLRTIPRKVIIWLTELKQPTHLFIFGQLSVESDETGGSIYLGSDIKIVWRGAVENIIEVSCNKAELNNIEQNLSLFTDVEKQIYDCIEKFIEHQESTE